MAQFVLVYLGGDYPSNKEESTQHMMNYQKWLSNLGEKAIEPANPFKNTRSIAPNRNVTEGSQIGMSGYTIIEANSIGEAEEITRNCPFLDINGIIEVSEKLPMPSF